MKATGKGTVTITAKATDGSGKSASCRVNGTVLVEQITIHPNPISLYVNWEQTTYCEVFPWNARNKAVSWASNNSGIASVDQYGTISGNAPGWCYITATAKDGSKVSDSVLVDVSVKSLERVTLNKYSMQLNVGKSETLIGTYSPADASYTWFSWVSDNTSVAVVDGNGKVTGKNAGTANISLVFAEITVTCQVTVKSNPSSGGSGSGNGGSFGDGNSNNGGSSNGGNNGNSSGGGNGNSGGSGTNIPVNYIYLNKTSEYIVVGDTLGLAATVNPSQAVTWSSSNKSVATVSGGTVKAHKPGTVKITAKAGGKSASCTVTVVENYFESLETMNNNERLNRFDEIIRGLVSYFPSVWVGDSRDVYIPLGAGAAVYFEEKVTGGLSFPSGEDGDMKMKLMMDKQLSKFNSFTVSSDISNIAVSVGESIIKFSASNQVGDSTSMLSAGYNLRTNIFNMECSIKTTATIGGASGAVTTTVGIENVAMMPPSSDVAYAYEQQRAEAAKANPESLLDGILDSLSNMSWEEIGVVVGFTIAFILWVGSYFMGTPTAPPVYG